MKKLLLLTSLITLTGLMSSTALRAQSSDIIVNTSFTYSTNIDYQLFVQASNVALTTSNSLEVGQFIIRDGGASADGDAFSTILDSLALQVTNSTMISRIGLFDGSTSVAQIAANGFSSGTDTAKFGGFTLTAPDDGTKTFSVRVTYRTTVVDNARNVFTIVRARAKASTSTFAANNAGGAATSNTGDNNKIEVTATKLLFSVQPSSTGFINDPLSTTPVVSAVDANSRPDLDFTGTITLTDNAPLGVNNGVSTASNGQATFTSLSLASAGTTFLITNNTAGLTNANSNSITITNAPEKKFDNEAGTFRYTDALNWKPNGIPDAFDNVVLDNQFLANSYTVRLDSQSVARTVKTFSIKPASGNSITMLLGSSNTTDPILTVDGASGQTAVLLKNGGTISNQSPVTVATDGSFEIANGVFKIEDGGRYEHATRAAHLDLATRLSTETGTRFGIFRFNVPGASDYEIAINNIFYGTLSLSRQTTGTYSGQGAGNLNIRGNLIIDNSVSLLPDIANINLEGSLTNSGTFDPSGTSVLVMKGSTSQDIAGNGIYQVNRLEINNSSTAGVTLSRALRLQDTTARLVLTNGRLFTTTNNILRLPNTTSVTGGSAATFISGPVEIITEKLGIRLAPVGKDTLYRPVTLNPDSLGTTTFSVQYFNRNPSLDGYDTSMRDAPLKRVSGREYWIISRSGTMASDATVRLGFGKLSGVTSLNEEDLRVAYWNGTKWVDKGGDSIKGDFTRGSVLSDAFSPVTSFGVFTLGTLDLANPLPVDLLYFQARLKGNDADLSWKTASELDNAGFYVERSIDGINFNTTIAYQAGRGTTQAENFYRVFDYNVHNIGAPVIYYRLKQVDFNGDTKYSSIAALRLDGSEAPVVAKANNAASVDPSTSRLTLRMNSLQNTKAVLSITDLAGRTFLTSTVTLAAGQSLTEIALPNMSAGVYVLSVTPQEGTSFVQKFALVR